MAITGFAGSRRTRARIAALVASRPGDRRHLLLVRSIEDLARLREANEAEREAFDAHAERVARSLGL